MIKIHREFKQGSFEWEGARIGLLTASEVSNILTPAKLDYSASAKGLVNKIASELITKRPSPSFSTYDMERGRLDEINARDMYDYIHGRVEQVGLITRDFDRGQSGYKIGYSPDGLVGNDGLIEAKSRLPKLQVETIINDEMPREYWLQVQTGLLVSGRKWCDFISYSEGMHLFVKRILPCVEAHNKIIAAADLFYQNVNQTVALYLAKVEENKMPYIQPVITLEDY